jgi:hypothetical protein
VNPPVVAPVEAGGVTPEAGREDAA